MPIFCTGTIRHENVGSIYLRFRLDGVGRSSGEPSSATSHSSAPRFGSMLRYARDTRDVCRIYTATVSILPTVPTVPTLTTTYFERRRVGSKSSRSSGRRGGRARRPAPYSACAASHGGDRRRPATTAPSRYYCLLFDFFIFLLPIKRVVSN
jgi:hypothetical protein